MLISHIPDEITVIDRCNIDDILSILQDGHDCVVKSLVLRSLFPIGVCLQTDSLAVCVIRNTVFPSSEGGNCPYRAGVTQNLS